MKKGIIVLLIAVLVSSFAFADFSGSAGVIYDADLENKAFDTTNAKSFDFSFTFASEKVEIAGDEDVHVEVAASAKFILGKLKVADGNGITIQNDKQADRGIGAVISLDTAKIVGKNWYVDITGTQGAYDYAKAAVLQINDRTKSDAFGNDYADDNYQASSYAVAFGNADGITVGYNGFTASVGFEYIKDFALLASATLETPEFAFSDDAVKVQAAAEFARFKLGDATQYLAVNTFGASAKATVAIQDITVGAAVDMGVENVGAEIGTISEKDTEFNVDARVDFKYNFVDASVYTYAGKAGLEFGTIANGVYSKFNDFYLEAKAAFDLNAFELPLKVTVSAKNITNSEVGGGLKFKYGIEPKVEVEYANDAIKAGASFEINTEFKDWSALVYGTYAFEKFTAGAGVSLAGLEGLDYVAFAAFAESDKLVNGATFGLGYGLNAASNKKFYGKGGVVAIADDTQYTANYKADTADLGNIAAYCKIAF